MKAPKLMEHNKLPKDKRGNEQDSYRPNLKSFFVIGIPIEIPMEIPRNCPIEVLMGILNLAKGVDMEGWIWIDGGGAMDFLTRDREKDNCQVGFKCYAFDMDIGHQESIQNDVCRFVNRRIMNMEERDGDDKLQLDMNLEV